MNTFYEFQSTLWNISKDFEHIFFKTLLKYVEMAFICPISYNVLTGNASNITDQSTN